MFCLHPAGGVSGSYTARPQFYSKLSPISNTRQQHRSPPLHENFWSRALPRVEDGWGEEEELDERDLDERDLAQNEVPLRAE